MESVVRYKCRGERGWVYFLFFFLEHSKNRETDTVVAVRAGK